MLETNGTNGDTIIGKNYEDNLVEIRLDSDDEDMLSPE